MKLNQLALAAAFLAVPFMAQADLRSLDDAALAGISGQDGISIAGDFNGTIGAIVYRDSDASGTGTLRLENVSMTGFSITDDNPLMIDVVTNTIGGTATDQLQITLPEMTGQVSIGAIRVGDGGASLGSLAIIDQNMAGTQLRICGHCSSDTAADNPPGNRRIPGSREQ